MKTIRSWIPVLSVLCVASGLFGCGDSVKGKYPVYKVSGTITYEDKPLEGATVVFYPEDSSMDAAHGMTDADGYYELTTFNQGDGAGVGNYKVTVKKFEGDGVSVDDGEEEEEVESEEGRRMKAKSLIPEEYGSLVETQLTADVTEDGDNEFSFKIE